MSEVPLRSGAAQGSSAEWLLRETVEFYDSESSEVNITGSGVRGGGGREPVTTGREREERARGRERERERERERAR